MWSNIDEAMKALMKNNKETTLEDSYRDTTITPVYRKFATFSLLTHWCVARSGSFTAIGLGSSKESRQQAAKVAIVLTMLILNKENRYEVKTNINNVTSSFLMKVCDQLKCELSLGVQFNHKHKQV